MTSVKPRLADGSFPDWGHPMMYGAAGAWLLNEGAGNRILDQSRYGWHGTGSNITWAISEFGPYLSFNGSTSVVDFGNPPDMTFERTDKISISVLLSLNATGAVYTIFQKMTDSGNTRGLLFNVMSGSVSFFLVSDYASNRIQVHSTTTLTANQLYRLTITYDGSSTAAGVKIYTNRAQDTTAVDANTLSATTVISSNAKIGLREASGQPFSGKIYNMLIWRGVVLTQEMVGWLCADSLVATRRLDVSWIRYVVGPTYNPANMLTAF